MRLRSDTDRGTAVLITKTALLPPTSLSNHPTAKMGALPLSQRRCWRRGRGGGMRIGELERLQRINEAGAEIVVALAGREPLGARGQYAANVSRRQFRIAFQQKCYDAADLCSRDGGAGVHLILALGGRHQNVNAWRCD